MSISTLHSETNQLMRNYPFIYNLLRVLSTVRILKTFKSIKKIITNNKTMFLIFFHRFEQSEKFLNIDLNFTLK